MYYKFPCPVFDESCGTKDCTATLIGGGGPGQPPSAVYVCQESSGGKSIPCFNFAATFYDELNHTIGNPGETVTTDSFRLLCPNSIMR